MKNENLLIAEFMGWEKIYKDAGQLAYCRLAKPNEIIRRRNIDELKYHTSWDWLMPVVDKIDNYLYKNAGKVGYFDECLHSNDLEVRYQAVVEFINQIDKESDVFLNN